MKVTDQGVEVSKKQLKKLSDKLSQFCSELGSDGESDHESGNIQKRSEEVKLPYLSRF